jgi:hypothetical protein
MPRTLIVLLSVALCLLGFIVLFERGSLSTTEREGRKGRVLAKFVRDRVSRVELQRRGVTTVLVHVAPKPDDPLDAGGWRVEAPYKAKADREEVDGLLAALEWAEAKRSLGDANAAEIKQFGLDAPRYRVSYVAGDTRGGIAVGLPASTGGGSYVKQTGEPAVYVVGGDLLEALDKAPEDFHDKSLHEGLTVYTLEHLALVDSHGAETKLARNAGFVWIESPFRALAGMQELTGLVNALDGMRAARYVSEKARDEYALQSPRFGLTLESLVFDTTVKNKRVREALELRVGGSCGEHREEAYVQLNQGAVFCIVNSELQKLELSADTLRETRVLPLDDSAILGVTLRDGKTELALETQEKGAQSTSFRLTEGGRETQTGSADPAALREWYAALRELKIERFEPLSQAQSAQLNASETVATFRRSKDHAPYVLHLARGGEPVLATRLDEPAQLQVPAATRSLLTPMAARLRKRRVLDENETQFSALTLKLAKGARERVVKQAGGYALTEPLSAPAESAAVDEILRLVSKLDVQSFAADRALPEHGFAAPYRVLDIEYVAEGKPRVHTLTLGNKHADSGRYARLDADPAVFVVANALADKLSGSLLKRTSAALARDQLAHVELAHDGQRVAIEVASTDGGPSIAGAGPASQARAIALLDTLTHLRADAVEPEEATHAVATGQKPLLELTARWGGATPHQRVCQFYGSPSGAERPDAPVPLRCSDFPVTFWMNRRTLDALLEQVPAKSAP